MPKGPKELTVQMSFRVTVEDAERFEAFRSAQDREQSDMARRVFRAGLDALSPGLSEPDQAEGITRAKARALDPDAQQRLRESRASAVAPVAAPSLPHPFHPQPNNSRCGTCGGRKADHR